MKKILRSTVNYYGKPARIAATVTDERGYISITADLIPYRCKTVHACGCMHDEIYRAFPKLRPFIWLHLVNVDGSVTYEIENSLYHFANGDDQAAGRVLGCCSDKEINDLSALVNFGLHKTKKFGFYSVDGDGRQVYENAVNKLNLRARRLHALKDLYGVLSSL